MRAPSRPHRHLALTTGVVLAVCAVLGAVSGATLAAASARLDAATARTVGVVSGVRGDTALLTWTPEGGAERTDPVRTAAAPPAPGTRTEIAYDPADPTAPLLPGAAVLADADRALTGLAVVAVVAVLVPAVAAALVLRWRRARTGAARRAAVRRVRVRAGLLQRSWLETGDRWLPVHFDPALTVLPAPATVTVHGGGAVTWEGHVFLPSGRARTAEPRGHRTDNPTAPDAETLARARGPAPLRRQLLADLPLVAGAPLAALLWTVVDGSGVTAWLGTTALLAALALFWAAVRGSDPT